MVPGHEVRFRTGGEQLQSPPSRGRHKPGDPCSAVGVGDPARTWPALMSDTGGRRHLWGLGGGSGLETQEAPLMFDYTHDILDQLCTTTS